MPRKSGASVTAASDVQSSSMVSHDGGPNEDTSTLSENPPQHGPNTHPKTSKKHDDNLGIDDLLLPRTLISRLARGILPANTSIQKDALLALTKSATVFISYLSSTANELTTKKTIGPQDVIKALHEMEMETIMGLGKKGADGEPTGRLERELELYENVVRGKRKGYRDKLKQRESDVVNTTGTISTTEGGDDDGDEPDTKRARLDSSQDALRESLSQPQPQSNLRTTHDQGHATIQPNGLNGTYHDYPHPSTTGGPTTTEQNGYPDFPPQQTSPHHHVPTTHLATINDDTEEEPLEDDDDETEPDDEDLEAGDDDDDDDDNDEEPEQDEEDNANSIEDLNRNLDADESEDDTGPDRQLRYEAANGLMAGAGASEDESD